MATDHERAALIPEGPDAEMVALIDSWRYAGPPTPWETIVGHERQVQRCRELLVKLSRLPDELERLRIRLGAGLVISGPAGVGKTLMARALASASGRTVVVPPVGELSASLIHRLYAQLAKAEPSVIILDEAEGLIGKGWLRDGDHDAFRALLAALDGVSRPQHGPITLALTTEPPESLDEAAIRPGRLAPHLVLGPPDEAERLTLLRRAIAAVPVEGAIDLGQIVDRTAGWTGAELVTAIEEACARSLLDCTDALRMDLLIEVLGERYTIVDLRSPTMVDLETWAIHEAGHALVAELVWPGGVQSVTLSHFGGVTQLAEHIERATATVDHLRRLASVALAGRAAERLMRGQRGTSAGADSDYQSATRYLFDVVAIEVPLSIPALEEGHHSDRGSERMRADLYGAVMREALTLEGDVDRQLTSHRTAISSFARALLADPDRTLSGAHLQRALARSLGKRTPDHRTHRGRTRLIPPRETSPQLLPNDDGA